MKRQALRVVIAFGMLAAAMQVRTVANRPRVVPQLVTRAAAPAPAWLPKPGSGRATLYTAGGTVPLHAAPNRDKTRGRR